MEPKDFYQDEYTANQIQELSDKDFNNLNPFELRSCYDCSSLKSVISLWCSNSEASIWRGSSIPGGIKCPFWSPIVIVKDAISYLPFEITVQLDKYKKEYKIKINNRKLGNFIFIFFLKIKRVLIKSKLYKGE